MKDEIFDYEIPEGIKLSRQKKLFLSEYFTNGYNATQAAKDANYSEKTAYSQGHRLLNNADIKKVVDHHFKQLAADNKLRKENAQKELLTILELDPFDFFHLKDGKLTLKPIEDIPKHLRKYINEISVSPTGIVRCKFFSKETAQEMLNKMEGHYGADNDQRRPPGAVIYLPDNKRGKK